MWITCTELRKKKKAPDAPPSLPLRFSPSNKTCGIQTAGPPALSMRFFWRVQKTVSTTIDKNLLRVYDLLRVVLCQINVLGIMCIFIKRDIHLSDMIFYIINNEGHDIKMMIPKILHLPFTHLPPTILRSRANNARLGLY